MKTNDRGIAVPSDDAILPIRTDGDAIIPSLVSEDGCVADTFVDPDFAEFLAVAANYHERMADIVRRLAEWNEGDPAADNYTSIASDASKIWAEYQEAVK